MSDKHEVTVQNVVDVTARVSEEQVRRYLKRSGWRPGDYRQYAWCRDDELHPICVASPLDRVIMRIAAFERCLPGEILLDITKEQS